MDEILHHFETMGNHCLLVYTGESSFQGFLGGARPSTVSPRFIFFPGECATRRRVVPLSATHKTREEWNRCMESAYEHYLQASSSRLAMRAGSPKNGCGGQNRFAIPFWWVGEFAHFRTYFSGDWNIHWGYDLDFDPWPNGWSRLGSRAEEENRWWVCRVCFSGPPEDRGFPFIFL